jgi:DNA-binding response OmpR family regulator
MARILVVEDDPANLRYASALLRQEGHEVIAASHGEEATDLADRARPDAVLLDIGLPDVGGIEVCRRLRARSGVPIIFLTARREDADKVTALDAGGDDYVVKPYSPTELAARVRAVLRRSRGTEARAASRIELHGVSLDPVARRAFVRGDEIGLTAREFDLLYFLMRNAGRALDRQAIFDAVWGASFFGDESALNVYVRQLRHKVELDPERPRLIQTVRGIGYRFAAKGEEEG